MRRHPNSQQRHSKCNTQLSTPRLCPAVVSPKLQMEQHWSISILLTAVVKQVQLQCSNSSAAVAVQHLWCSSRNAATVQQKCSSSAAVAVPHFCGLQKQYVFDDIGMFCKAQMAVKTSVQPVAGLHAMLRSLPPGTASVLDAV